MMQVASAFNLNPFYDLRLAISCSMALYSFQASCDAHHIILRFLTLICFSTLFAAREPHFPSPLAHLKSAEDLLVTPIPVGYRNHPRGTHSEGMPWEAAKPKGQASLPWNFNLSGVCHISASQPELIYIYSTE